MEPKYYTELYQLLEARNSADVQYFSATCELMGEVIGYEMHHGIMATASAPSYNASR